MEDAAAPMLDDRPIAARQIGVLALILLALVIDGVDIQLLALVAPVILKEWALDRAAFGPALSAALIGMAIGAGIGGWLGDRIGRKTALIGSMLWFGLATLAASRADGLASLALLRLLSGLGFGAVAPNGAALVTEWMPVRARALIMAGFSVVVPLGGIISASTVLALLSSVGWRGCFIACGGLTLALAALLIVLLPESPSFLRERCQADKADRLLARIAPGASLPPPPSTSGTTAFTRANLRLNLGSWLGYFSMQFIAYAIVAWAPLFLTMINWPLPQAIRATVAFNVSAIVASIVTGLLLTRYNFRPIILLACAGTLASVALLAATTGVAPATVAIGGIGAFSGAGIAAIYTLLAFAYPVSCRSSGIGIGLMMGRAGGIAVTLIGGWLLSLDGDSPLPFYGSLAVAVLAALAGTWLLGSRLPSTRHTRVGEE